MKVHILSNSLKQNSGFSKVSMNIAKGLEKLGHDISITGMQTAYTREYNFGFEVLPIQTFHIDDVTQYVLNLQNIRPDVSICVFQMDADMNAFTKVFSPTITYTPVEGKSIPLQMANDLKDVIKNKGVVVAQCRYGQEEMKKIGVDAKCIYHGFDPNIFRPLKIVEDYCYYGTEVGKNETNPILLYRQGCYDCKLNKKDQTKCKYFKQEVMEILRYDNGWIKKTIKVMDLKIETRNNFIYGFVGMNFGLRKRIERLLSAYSILINESKQLKDHTMMHLHCMPIAINGINLINIIEKLGMQNNVIFSFSDFRSNGISEEGMNIIYNSFDCNVSASSSEGFGLGTLESMAVGIPNIGPNCSSFTELIGNSQNKEENRGLLANILDYQMIQDGSYRALVDERDLALKMKIIYENQEQREFYSKNAIKFVGQFNWTNICQQWDGLLKKI